MKLENLLKDCTPVYGKERGKFDLFSLDRTKNDGEFMIYKLNDLSKVFEYNNLSNIYTPIWVYKNKDIYHTTELVVIQNTKNMDHVYTIDPGCIVQIYKYGDSKYHNSKIEIHYDWGNNKITAYCMSEYVRTREDFEELMQDIEIYMIITGKPAKQLQEPSDLVKTLLSEKPVQSSNIKLATWLSDRTLEPGVHEIGGIRIDVMCMYYRDEDGNEKYTYLNSTKAFLPYNKEVSKSWVELINGKITVNDYPIHIDRAVLMQLSCKEDE